MKKLLLFPLLAVIGMFHTLSAQKITYEQSFNVRYSITGMGYPSEIVPNMDGGYAYIEYWPQGQGKKFANHYLQSYNKDWKEEWFLPITQQGAAKMGSLIQVARFNNNIGIIGTQYSPSAKRDQVKMQLVAPDGQPVGGMHIISSYSKKEKKDFVDEFAFAPDNSRMLWLGHNPASAASKRIALASVWDGSGKKTWGRRLTIPHLADDKYLIKQAAVDKRGHAYFLLIYEEMTNSDKDTLHRPIIVRYDHRENKFTEHQLNFPQASLPESHIYITEQGELAFLGILSDSTHNGFLNGAKRYGAALSWDKIVYQLFDVERELKLRNEYAMEFPQAWLDRYQKRQANFSKAEVVESGGKLYWILEEHFTQIHNNQPQFLYKDVATVAIDKESGEALWANFFEKNQRDYRSGRLLSYSKGISKGKLNFVYLNERGAQGKIVCSSFDLNDGTSKHKNLALNDKATYLFYPGRSSMVSSDKMILMGIGDPVGNDYKLMEVTFE